MYNCVQLHRYTGSHTHTISETKIMHCSMLHLMPLIVLAHGYICGCWHCVPLQFRRYRKILFAPSCAEKVNICQHKKLLLLSFRFFFLLHKIYVKSGMTWKMFYIFTSSSQLLCGAVSTKFQEVMRNFGILVNLLHDHLKCRRMQFSRFVSLFVFFSSSFD